MTFPKCHPITIHLRSEISNCSRTISFPTVDSASLNSILSSESVLNSSSSLIRLSYFDDDHDEIILTTDDELRDAIQNHFDSEIQLQLKLTQIGNKQMNNVRWNCNFVTFEF